MKTILITGGTGFIGSHTSLLLLNKNYKIIIVDNLCNSKFDTFNKLKEISGNKNLYFFNKDLCKDSLEDIFKNNNIYAVIHFAGLKSVNESINDPLKYYQINILSTLKLLNYMISYNCNKLIFSSSATVYGTTKAPLFENSKIGENISNPYGQTKFIIENILKDFCKSNKNFSTVILRYFNPIGSHPSGLIGENPNNIPNNLCLIW